MIRAPDRQRVPRCRIRAYRDDDFEVCAEIFRLNEGKHFPVGAFENFAEKLRNEEKRPLELVAEVIGHEEQFEIPDDQSWIFNGAGVRSGIQYPVSICPILNI